MVFLTLAAFAICQGRPYISKVWLADQGDGTYRNPIIHADYSDPDLIRVGQDFYMTASSFQCIPGLPILHSRDLVNWELIGHAITHLAPEDIYCRPQHGCGVWAPAIRFHKGWFYIYYADPDYGIFMVRAKDPIGPWSEPIPVKRAKGWIDPCPLWDRDGKAYLVNAMAASRSGIKSVLIVSRLSPDGTTVLDDGVIVFDGHDRHPTVEGPKFYKRKGYYYIFAPAGGVTSGWQLVLRSRSVYGPYEHRVVLAQGNTPINGPHQGGWVQTAKGEDWFIHFQDKGPYGRVVHLQPMQWVDDWPVIGQDPDGDGTGEPVLRYRKPRPGGPWHLVTPPESDEFDQPRLGLQWQWHANPQPNWGFPTGLGFLRLYCVAPPEGHRNLWDVPNLLLQKFPADTFTATIHLRFNPSEEGQMAGLLVMGTDYAYIAICSSADGMYIRQVICRHADRAQPEGQIEAVPAQTNQPYLRVTVDPNAGCTFSFSTDGLVYQGLGRKFIAQKGRWIGAKVGIFTLGSGRPREMGYADIDWFRME